MSVAALTATQIPCCLCGSLIFPNNANQCSSCLAQEFNLKERLQRGPGGADHITIYQCRQCRRYKRTEKHYENYTPESPELLALCLKQIPALQNQATANIGSGTSGQNSPLHLVDAGWIWTEPHSMRFKLRLTVRTELQSVVIQQRVMVLLHCAFQMCKNCNREYTNRTWQAVVQLRQKRSDDAPKKGLAALEMALAKNKEIRKHVLRIDSVKSGLDFYFLEISHAQGFCSYLQSVAPMRTKSSSKLVSTDAKNNTANVKQTFTCDLVPLCKDDLLLIDKRAKCKLAGRLCIVTKLASGVIHLMDASPKRYNLTDSQMELSAEAYYKHEKHYQVLQSSHRMSRFVVLDVELCDADTNSDTGSSYKGPASEVDKHALADVQVARESDFGVNDETFSSVSHLGHLLSAGDTVLGYDLEASIGGDWRLEDRLTSTFILPDTILAKKISSVTSGSDYGDEGEVKHDTIKAARKDRRRRKEGKRMRDLEARAARMGFIDEKETHELNKASIDKDLANDPELAAEVMALERDLEAIGSKLNAGLPLETLQEVKQYKDITDNTSDEYIMTRSTANGEASAS